MGEVRLSGFPLCHMFQGLYWWLHRECLWQDPRCQASRDIIHVTQITGRAIASQIFSHPSGSTAMENKSNYMYALLWELPNQHPKDSFYLLLEQVSLLDQQDYSELLPLMTLSEDWETRGINQIRNKTLRPGEVFYKSLFKMVHLSRITWKEIWWMPAAKT